MYKYPVKLELTVNKREKREIDEIMALLVDAHNQMKNVQLGFKMHSDFHVLLLSLKYAEENQDIFDDFIKSTLSSTTDSRKPNGYQDSKKTSTPKCCFVCGSEISSSATFNVFSSEKINNT